MSFKSHFLRSKMTGSPVAYSTPNARIYFVDIGLHKTLVKNLINID